MKLPILIILGISVLACNPHGQRNMVTNSQNSKSRSGECIENIIQVDQKLGKIRNHSSEKISLSETITEYTDSLSSLNYDDCPGQFTTAFKEHIEAWKDVKRVTDNYLELRGEMHDLFDELEKGKDSIEFKLLSKRIWDTWGKVELATTDRDN